eukprot:CAMPEP_0178774062 /NCGR_PEP_ID=MMETSP0744-20121128/23439_1 /TAXON_ID=913974 /ORGANISM="Nitzschia punctata, Strain CCMP561" /LENGTH=44 /DNA_ID= /DNA_START= /DNA_END= /DNA_ORIENTATION=
MTPPTDSSTISAEIGAHDLAKEAKAIKVSSAELVGRNMSKSGLM